MLSVPRFVIEPETESWPRLAPGLIVRSCELSLPQPLSGQQTAVHAITDGDRRQHAVDDGAASGLDAVCAPVFEAGHPRADFRSLSFE